MGLNRFIRVSAALLLALAPIAVSAQQGGGDAPASAEQPAAGADEAPQVHSSDTALLRGLDKLTGATVEFEAPVGADSAFERLRIKLDACQMRGAEHAAFLQIFDSARPEGLDLVFSGWMFASSPALSALDHPRYDVWLQSCKTS